jgi:hypothetical protein
MLRGEKEFLFGMVLLFVGPIIGGAVGSMLFPAAVILCIIGILFILACAFDTGG